MPPWSFFAHPLYLYLLRLDLLSLVEAGLSSRGFAIHGARPLS
jgi:hypothetical protein